MISRVSHALSTKTFCRNQPQALSNIFHSTIDYETRKSISSSRKSHAVGRLQTVPSFIYTILRYEQSKNLIPKLGEHFKSSVKTESPRDDAKAPKKKRRSTIPHNKRHAQLALHDDNSPDFALMDNTGAGDIIYSTHNLTISLYAKAV